MLYSLLVRTVCIRRTLTLIFNMIYREDPSLSCIIIIYQRTSYTGNNKILSNFCNKPTINPFFSFTVLENNHDSANTFVSFNVSFLLDLDCVLTLLFALDNSCSC